MKSISFWLALCATCTAQPFATGAVSSTPTQLDEAPKLVLRFSSGYAAPRPPRLQLRKYLPPIASQGGQPSCVSWATTYYAYTYAVAQNMALNSADLQSTSWQFSPAYVYNQIDRGKRLGTTIAENFRIVKEQGCAFLERFPYRDSESVKQPDSECTRLASEYAAPAVYSLFSGGKFDPERVAQVIFENETPVVINTPTGFSDLNWQNLMCLDSNYILNIAPGKALPGKDAGWHAVTVVGYDDSRQALEIVNSWGRSWGNNGFAWLSYNFCRSYCGEAWAFVAAGGATAKADPQSNNDESMRSFKIQSGKW